MSYSLNFVAVHVPNRTGQAWDFLDDLQDRYEQDRGRTHPQLKRLHDLLVARYPCPPAGDPLFGDCVWADGPLINQFASEMAMVAIKPEHAEEVVAFAVESALALGITVMDAQDEKIYRRSSAND